MDHLDQHQELQQLQQLRQALEREATGRTLDRATHTKVHDIQRRIVEGANAVVPPILNRASQSLAAAALLLHTMPEPYTTEGRRIHDELWELLECAEVQQAESSPSRLQEPASSHQVGPSRFEREALVHPAPTKERSPTMHNHLRDNHQP